ncbi:MAG: hypothetical protein JWL61_1668 [Gemmatimonadetes bacterium]|nr:hypothetical protein [Gemmatimonadota bacterium]
MRHRTAMCVLLSVAGPGGLHAQRAGSGTYVTVSGGVAVERATFAVRSDLGFALAAAAGRQLSAHVAVETRVSAARFSAPAQFISPGGCLGAQPCVPPVPSVVTAITIGESVVYRASWLLNPSVNAGAGIRRLSQSADGAEVRPYSELGAGLGTGVGTTVVSLEARMQMAPTSRDFARWVVPISVGVRF